MHFNNLIPAEPTRAPRERHSREQERSVVWSRNERASAASKAEDLFFTTGRLLSLVVDDKMLLLQQTPIACTAVCDSSPTKRRYTRLTESQWAEVRAQWKVGDLSLAELSEAYGVSPRALQLHFAKHGLVKGSEGAAFAAAIEETILRETLPDKDLTARRARDVREAAYANAVVLEGL